MIFHYFTVSIYQAFEYTKKITIDLANYQAFPERISPPPHINLYILKGNVRGPDRPAKNDARVT